MRVEASSTIPLKTSMVYGGSRAGKTHFVATYPKVAIVSAKREDGLATIDYMDPAQWYNPKQRPLTYYVEDIAQMMLDLTKEIIPMAEAGIIETIAIELSVHADDVLRTVPLGDNQWAKYRALEEHIMRLDAMTKRLPKLHVVYNALALAAGEKTQVGGPMLPGKQLAPKIPALTALCGYMRSETVEPADGAPSREDHVLHLSPYGNWMCGHRYGKRLPALVRNPTFRDMEDLILGRAQVDSEGYVVRESKKLTSLPPLSTLAKTK